MTLAIIGGMALLLLVMNNLKVFGKFPLMRWVISAYQESAFFTQIVELKCGTTMFS